jgi:hypothetical protein
LNELSNLKGLVEAELARRTDLEKQIKIERIFVEPIYRGDERIGSRVWDNNHVELMDDDPRFKQAVIGNKRHPGAPCDFPDDHPAFRRVVPSEPVRPDRTVAEDAIVASAAAKIAALRARQ